MQGEIVSPYLVNKGITGPTTIIAGQSATLELNYDLLGVDPASTEFPVDMQVTEVSSGVTIYDSGGEWSLATGTDQQLPFNITSTRGYGNGSITASITVQITVPSFGYTNKLLFNLPHIDPDFTFTIKSR